MEYPTRAYESDGYEETIVLIPEPTGDYFLSKITSSGGYDLLEEVRNEDVKILITEKDLVLPRPTK